MADCPKLAKRRKLEKDPDAENAKTAIHLDMTKKSVTSVQIWKTVHLNGPSQKPRKRFLKTTNKPIKPSRWTTTIILQGFKLESPRLYTKTPQKQNSADDWQHQLSPKPTETPACETDLTTESPQRLTLETQLIRTLT